MKKPTLVTLVIFVITQLMFSQETSKRVTINNTSQNLYNLLSNQGIDLRCGAIHDKNKITLELGQYELDLLNNNGISYTIEVNDLTKYYKAQIDKTYDKALLNLEIEKSNSFSLKTSVSNTTIDNLLEYTGCSEIDWITPSNFNLGSMGGCLTVSETLTELDDMKTLFPSLISAKTDASPTNQTTWGNTQGTESWAPQTIYYVRITGNQSSPEGTKPQILYTSMIHAREVSSLMSNIYFMWYLLENYATDSAVKNLVDNNELYFIPIVNPDGLRWNEHVSSSGGAMQRKNLRPNTGGTGNTSVNRGVDLNRNFDYFWGTAGSGSSGTQTSGSYRGPSAFSEPESQILRDFVLARNFQTATMNHSFANAIPHPYGGNPTFVSGREDEMHKWHEDMTRYNRYVSGATIFSAANGIADDWMVGGSIDANGSTGSGQNILATTPEHGDSGFWPPTTDIVPIAKRAMRIYFMNALHGGKYAKFHDLTQSDITTLTSDLTFGIERLGQTASDFTLTVTPISSNITSITSPVTETGMAILEQRNVTAQLILNGSIAPNDKIEFRVQLANGNGVIFYDADIVKYYQPSVLLSDNPDTDLLTNWTTTGSWTASTVSGARYSGTRGIKQGGNTVSPYTNNNTSTLTTATSYNFSNASEILIQYYSKWDLERNFDFVEILGSTNGTTWQQLCGNYTKPNANSNTNDAHSGKSGTSHAFQANNSSGQVYDGDRFDNWVMEEIVIDATNNSFLLGATTAQIKFRFRSDSSNISENYSTTSDGFFIDDFKIITIACSTVWYLDADNDNFAVSTITQCISPGVGYTTTVLPITDCDDTNSAINPGATEIPDNSIDENCDGADAKTWFRDADSDTYGDPIVTSVANSQPAGFVANNTDCNDTNSAINPGAIEIPDNAVDENCDGALGNTLDIQEFNLDKVLITPNPFNSVVTIELPNNSKNNTFNILLFDLNGKIIYNQTTASINRKISIYSFNKISSGAYFIKLADIFTGEYTIKKLIKE